MTTNSTTIVTSDFTNRPRPTFRQGAYFYGGNEADNTTSSVLKDLEIYAAINPPGTNTPDVVYASTGTVFVAKTPETFTYDADGNMTSDGRFHYTWNGENRLVMASNDTVVVTYAYGHRGRMVSKTLCGSAALRDENSSRISRTVREIKSTTYIWDDWNIIREIVREGDSVAVTDNIWGLDLDGTLQGAGGVGGLLAVVRDDGVFLPTYDANGNVSEYVTTNGEIVAHYDYSPFGEPLVASGPLAATFTHQFSTKPYCVATGFSEYQMRKYRPEIGRWMSRDPIFEVSDATHQLLGLNSTKKSVTTMSDRYSPFPNELVSRFDYLGLVCQCCFKFRKGKLFIDESCRGILKIWIIPEKTPGNASGAEAGKWISVDGFVINGKTYKVDGSSCIKISCTKTSCTIESCVNLIASMGGKKPPYIVPPKHFGGPPKEPEEGKEPPYVK